MSPEMSFWSALKIIQEILSSNSNLISRGTLYQEAEEILRAAIRYTQGKGLSRMEIYSRINESLPPLAAEWIIRTSNARAQGKPLQYLTGVQVFLNHEYEVSPGVLIPRPETEVLVRCIQETLQDTLNDPRFGLELGLGSGVISIELLAYFKNLKIVASELSSVARSCALQNANHILGNRAIPEKRLQILEAFHPGEVLEPFQRQGLEFEVDFIVSNPPYLTLEDVEDEVLKNEPHEALFAPAEDPLYFYRKIANQAGQFIKSGGWVFVEVPHERAQQILELFIKNSENIKQDEHWDINQTKIINDLTGRGRVLISQFNRRK